MKNFNQKLKIPVLLFAICYLLFAIFYFAGAQTAPQFLVSWQADSYVPSWYQGKIFPTNGSKIGVNFELLENGKIVNLSKIKVRWYINDKLIRNESNGLGIKSLSFTTSDYPGYETEVRITLPDYKGNVLDEIIRIPVVSAEATIDSPYSDNQVYIGGSSFLAHPFFFNIKKLNELSFEWFVDGRLAKEGERMDKLDLNIDPFTPSGWEINVQPIIKNLLNQMEFAGKNIKLRTK